MRFNWIVDKPEVIGEDVWIEIVGVEAAFWVNVAVTVLSKGSFNVMLVVVGSKDSGTNIYILLTEVDITFTAIGMEFWVKTNEYKLEGHWVGSP